MNNEITPIEENENISFLDEIEMASPNTNNNVLENVEESNEKIKLPDWDLLPPFETVDRSDQNDN